MAKSIPLTKGFVAIVDDEDYERISAHKWRVLINPSGHMYARRAERVGKGKYREVLMHREVLGLSPDDRRYGDHENGNGLDNRRCNLRPATPTNNQGNRNRPPRSASGYRGVSWSAKAGKWRAAIGSGERYRWLGLFDCPIEAARAYDRAAVEHFGEFARLNFGKAEAPAIERVAA